MSTTDIDPCEGTLKLENEKFARNSANKTVVRVADDDALAVLNNILTQLGGSGGTAFHTRDSRVTTPNTEQTVISFNVPASTTRTLSKVVVSCRQRVKFRVEVNSVQVASGRTAPGESNAVFIWAPGYAALTTETVEVFVEQFGGPASDVETYLMATDT